MAQPVRQQNAQAQQTGGNDVNEKRAAAALDKQRGQERLNQERGSEPVEDVSDGTQVSMQDKGGAQNINEREKRGGSQNRNENQGEQKKKAELEQKRNQKKQKTEQNKKQTTATNKKGGGNNGLSWYPIPFLFLVMGMDLIDPFSGSLGGIIVVLDAAGLGILSFYLYTQGAKAKRNVKKAVLGGLLDLIPILSILPWETIILIGVNASMGGGGIIGSFIDKGFSAAEKAGKIKKKTKKGAKKAKNTKRKLSKKFSRS